MTIQALTKDNLSPLLANHAPPCLSLYQPTHRRAPENLQDRIRYKNLLKALEQSLRLQHATKEVETLMAPLQELADDAGFWNHAAEGLAIFACAEFLRIFKLQQTVGELAIVANSFHIKPLLRIVQSVTKYQVLCVTRHEVRLFEGDSDTLSEIELPPQVPRSVSEALGKELTEPHQTVASYGGTALGSSMRHGHGSREEEVEIDDERFFRAVDRAVLEYCDNPAGLPLILATPRQYQTRFRHVSHNSFLLPDGIATDPNALTNDQLRQMAWEIVEPEFRARVQKLVSRFEEAKAKGQGSDSVDAIAEAATQGRVATLLVVAEARIPGRIDMETGRVTLNALEDPEVDDLLDDLAELVMRRGGDVVVIPSADFPSNAGAAAVFRF